MRHRVVVLLPYGLLAVWAVVVGLVFPDWRFALIPLGVAAGMLIGKAIQQLTDDPLWK